MKIIERELTDVAREKPGIERAFIKPGLRNMYKSIYNNVDLTKEFIIVAFKERPKRYALSTQESEARYDIIFRDENGVENSGVAENFIVIDVFDNQSTQKPVKSSYYHNRDFVDSALSKASTGTYKRQEQTSNPQPAISP